VWGPLCTIEEYADMTSGVCQDIFKTFLSRRLAEAWRKAGGRVSGTLAEGPTEFLTKIKN